MSKVEEFLVEKEGVGHVVIEMHGMEQQTDHEQVQRSTSRKKNAPRRHHIALTEQLDNDGKLKCYRIDCGYALRGQKRVRKAFYLGKDRIVAERLSLRIRDRWRDIKAAAFGSKAVWSDADLAEIQYWVNGREAPATPDERGALLCHEVLDRYVQDQVGRLATKEIGKHHLRAVNNALRWLKARIPNLPMRAIDDDWLMKISRVIRTPYVSSKTGQQIASTTINQRLAHTMSWLRWADRKGYWKATKQFYADRSLWFLPKKTRVKVDGYDREQGEPEIFTDAELRTIWEYLKRSPNRTGPMLKAFFLLGLNAGFVHSEFGHLHVSSADSEADRKRWRVEVDQNGTWWVKGPRPKTGVQGQIKLWPETVQAMLAAKAPDNRWGLWFLSTKGQPLIDLDGSEIAKTYVWWWDLRNAAREADPSFPDKPLKHLRKTGAQLVRTFADYFSAELWPPPCSSDILSEEQERNGSPQQSEPDENRPKTSQNTSISHGSRSDAA